MPSEAHYRRRSSIRGVFAVMLFVAGFTATARGEDMKWSPCGLGGQEINALAIDPADASSMYAATSEGIFKSTDSCVTWKASDTHSQEGQAVALAIDPANPSLLYSLRRKIDSVALYGSSDGGNGWTEIQTDINQGHFKYWSGKSSLAIDPANPSVLYLVGPRLWVSLDRGQHWRDLKIISESDVISLAIDPASPATLYLGTANNDAMKSTDGGQKWSGLAVLMESPFGVDSIVVDPVNPSVLYAGTWAGVHRSTDSGAHWAESSDGLNQAAYHPGVSSIVVDHTAPATVYAAMGDRVYKSTDSGKNWVYAGTNLAELNFVKQLLMDPKDHTILYAMSKNGIWKLQ